MSSKSELARLAWLGALDAHVEAARAHDSAAAVFARRGDLASAEQAWAFAAHERAMHEAALARHPEWVPGKSDPAKYPDGVALLDVCLPRRKWHGWPG